MAFETPSLHNRFKHLIFIGCACRLCYTPFFFFSSFVFTYVCVFFFSYSLYFLWSVCRCLLCVSSLHKYQFFFLFSFFSTLLSQLTSLSLFCLSCIVLSSSVLKFWLKRIEPMRAVVCVCMRASMRLLVFIFALSLSLSHTLSFLLFLFFSSEWVLFDWTKWRAFHAVRFKRTQFGVATSRVMPPDNFAQLPICVCLKFAQKHRNRVKICRIWWVVFSSSWRIEFLFHNSSLNWLFICYEEESI